MKLNVYKNQTDVEKTFEANEYDLMYGTVEDILSVFDELEDYNDNMEIFKVVNKNRSKINDLILDVFPDMTTDDLRKIKLKELVPFFMDLFAYVKTSFGGSEKN